MNQQPADDSATVKFAQPREVGPHEEFSIDVPIVDEQPKLDDSVATPVQGSFTSDADNTAAPGVWLPPLGLVLGASIAVGGLVTAALMFL